jgi:3D (Asp-Asp-Asp) domain-containing protein
MGAALLAGIAEQRSWDVLKAMHLLADAEAAAAGDLDAAERVQMAAVPYSLNEASGLAAGSVLRARITVYGCSGPGGGFCNHMSAGGVPFEGAAACSSNLPFGTRLTIEGDPTGRTYECLDRGALAATWIDVYFENTSDGIAWQSTLDSTVADIHIVN